MSTYRTIPYSRVLRGATTLAGIEWENVQTNVLRNFIEFISDRVEKAWTEYRWPDLTVIEPRVVSNDNWPGTLLIHGDFDDLANDNNILYSAASIANWIITAGTYVYYDGNATTGDLAAYDAGWYEIWDDLMGGTYDIATVLADPDTYLIALTTAPTRRTIPFNQTFRFEPLSPDSYFVAEYRELNDSIEIFKDDPRAVKSPRPVGFEVISDDGIILEKDAPELVWVRHRIKPYQFNGDIWVDPAVSGVSYSGSAEVYFEDRGEFYRSLKSSNADQPHYTNSWQLLPFPRVLLRYVKWAAFADYLRSEGEFERGDRMEAKADGFLADDWYEQCKQIKLVPKVRVVGRGR